MLGVKADLDIVIIIVGEAHGRCKDNESFSEFCYILLLSAFCVVLFSIVDHHVVVQGTY